MNTAAHRRDQKKRPSAVDGVRAAGASFAHFLLPDTSEEQERRRAYLVALLLVAGVATFKHVTGLTGNSASFTMYLLAIAISGRIGGFGPASVATLAAVLLVDTHAPGQIGWAGRIVFALEGLGVAALIGAITRGLHETAARLARSQEANVALCGQAERDRLTQLALRHLEEVAGDAAVFVVSAPGMIMEWSPSAERMYGYSADQIVGSSFTTLLPTPSASRDAQDVLMPEMQADQTPRPAVHRRSDGTRMHVEAQIRSCDGTASQYFTVAVQDLARRRETEAFREAALRAQVALQKAADDAQHQVATLESLTDPAVNPGAGPPAAVELLERLRSTIGADGIAFVQLGRIGARMVSGAGLRPVQVRVSGTTSGSYSANGLVALVHNDATRVAQVSALTWPRTVSSLIVVPVCRTGTAAFTLEIVNERRAAATEWDLVLARIVADRLTQAVAHQVSTDSDNAVA